MRKWTGRLWLTLSLSTAVPLIRQTLAFLPYEPRLVVRNESDEIEELTIEDGNRRWNLGRLTLGSTIVLPIKVEHGRRYTILGKPLPREELRRLIKIASNECRDIAVTIDFHGCLVLEGHELNALTLPGYGSLDPDE